MDLSAVEETLRDAVAFVQNVMAQIAVPKAHFNEVNTEHMIIEPLLRAMGYEPWEIHKRGQDAVTGKFPDYTLLPETEHKWFLEAKRLDFPLKDGEAAQAASYAAHQGAQWAVLTNGRTWYIYNAHFAKPLPQKRVFEIADIFADPQAVLLLSLLARLSMTQNGLTARWQAERLRALVRHELDTPTSAARKALRKAAETELQSPVSDAALAQTLAALLGTGQAPGDTYTPANDAEDEAGLTLAALATDAQTTTHRCPAWVRLGGGPPVLVKTWSQLAQKVVVFVSTSYGLPALPFIGSASGKRYFLNTAPLRADDGPMKTPVRVEVGPNAVYLDMNRNAHDTVRVLAMLLQAVGAPPGAIQIGLAEDAPVTEKTTHEPSY